LAFFETRQAESFFARLTQQLQNWLSELDNSGTNRRNIEKKQIDSLLRANKDPDVSPAVYKSVALVFRFFQLLCENHNLESQLCLKRHNLVQMTMDFVDATCGTVSAGFGINTLFTTPAKIALINQTLVSLTEYCQGPCAENQMAIATHDSHGIDICMSVILHDIGQIATSKLDSALELKNNATKFLQSTLESNHSPEIMERILYNIGNPVNMTRALKQMHHLHDERSSKISEEIGLRARSVGHDIYILAHQLGLYNHAFAKVLREDEDLGLAFYRDHTGY